MTTQPIASESPATLTNGAPVATNATITLETREITALLDEVRTLMGTLDGQTIPLDFDRGRNRENKADIAAFNRELLRAIELCQLAGAEVAMLYWRIRGYRDPRFEDGPHPGGFTLPHPQGR